MTVNESRRLLQHRRFRRPRRLRRVYEVLSESTTSSNSDPDDDNQESDAENNHEGVSEVKLESIQHYSALCQNNPDLPRKNWG